MKQISDLIEITEKHLSLPNINCKSRKIEYIEARSLVYVIIRKFCGYKLQDIAKHFNKNHATILHSISQWPYLVQANPNLESTYYEIVEEFTGKIPKNPKNILNLLQIKIKSLEKKNKMLTLSHKVLRTKVKNMVWANDDFNYTIDDVDRIYGYKSWSEKEKIDALLHIDCNLYCNLGEDSTLKDRKLVKQQSKSIYRTIKKIDARVGTLLLTSMD